MVYHYLAKVMNVSKENFSMYRKMFYIQDNLITQGFNLPHLQFKSLFNIWRLKYLEIEVVTLFCRVICIVTVFLGQPTVETLDFCGQRPPQLVVAKGNNILEVTETNIQDYGHNKKG